MGVCYLWVNKNVTDSGWVIIYIGLTFSKEELVEAVDP